MAWYHYIAYFLAGAFLANGIPHFVHGIGGKRFPSPFASPPGVGESSPLVNVIWGMVNLVIGYVLIFVWGVFALGLNLSALAVFLGALVTAVALSAHFGHQQSR